MWPETTAPFAIDGLVGWIALGLPLFLLATMVALALRHRRSKRPGIAATEDTGDRLTQSTTPNVEKLGVLSQMKTLTRTQSESATTHSDTSFSVVSSAGGAAVLATLEGAGNRSEAVEALGALVFQAAASGETDVQAAARLQLGDLAENAGDMTTACEHWQIARDLFHKSDNILACEMTEDKMQSNGCPTDWVLNQF